eukprot:CAMPEP_0172328136 /NCGR_PEP_ID=MMETSP1058-20130122/60192_1 /TAXON_ID=83371 /ORGANISM="Detonula confervacea, Strain CCMP 353" /LENGTH=1251 /DNA_ID=CAMNT_0013045237 /DNA_START=1035 /DNA_END=4787 /DNA_ORIENTATION=-
MDSLAASAPSPIGIRDWMKSACEVPSKNAFVESAVDLAWMLTKHICQMATASSSRVKLEDHITADDILIFVERPSLILQGIIHTPVVTEVKFQFEASGVMSLLSVAYDASSATPSCPRAVCAALGKILLKIFSKGRSSSLEFTSGADHNSDTRCIQNNQAIPPAGKRQAAMPRSNRSISSTTANNLLLELGMPLSICRLVCDLLDDGNESSSNSFSSVKEVFWDLTQMKTSPESFLFDLTCPKKALDYTCLFDNTDRHLFGREEEMRALTMARNIVSDYVSIENNANDSVSAQGSNFLCEVTFLRGYAGSGKSSLLRSLVDVCNEEQWFVLGCKFDKQAAPHMILAKAFDDFFGKWGTTNNGTDSDSNPLMMKSFHEVCRCIFATVDNEGFDQLCDLMPNFARLFPLLSSRSNNRDQSGISSMDKVGSAYKRRIYLFHVLVKSLCSVGCPVLLSFDDLQWSQSFVIEGMTVPISDCSISSTTANNVLLELGMPLSIRQLVCDLLDAGNQQSSNLALTLVQEAFWDLTQMNASPLSFLSDRTCPKKALDDTCLFGNTDKHLYGRDEEMEVLMMARNNVSGYVHDMKDNTNDLISADSSNFLCEAAFVRGYAGSGKSSLLRSLVNVCNEEQWFVLGCKFDKQAALHMILAKAFDNFFGKWGTTNNGTYSNSNSNPSMMKSFHEVCRCIFATVDSAGFDQLSDLVPNFARIFPHFSSRINNQDQGGISSIDKVGSANKRRNHLFHVLLVSLCSAGRPVLLSLDDLQWSQSFVIEGMADFIASYMNSHDTLVVPGEKCRRGLLVVGTFRSNEVKESGDLIERINFIKQSGKANVTMYRASGPLVVDDLQWSQSFVIEGMADFIVNYMNSHDTPEVSDETHRRGLLVVGTFRSDEVKESDDLIERINDIKQSGKANVTMLTVGELTKVDITKLISAKLCLPWRHTQELAGLVHGKTARGNPFFVIQFLRSITKNKMLEFSIEHRRWMWDCDIVDMQMISDDVAKLLTKTFSKLPFHLMQTVKIVSCLGSQVEESTIIALNSRNEVLSFNMLNELEQAVKEGIMEKAGPMYQFTHDIVQQTIYELIQSKNQTSLHKTIGETLFKSAGNNPTLHLLAVDQILPFDMLNQLEQAVQEGIMEKAGPMYQFTHDIIQQHVYELRPSSNSTLLHKRIGKRLLESAANNSTVHLLAVDQINVFCKDGNLSHEECAQYAHANATAAKFALGASSFEQARAYINIGIQLLKAQHWQTQYSLSLNL